MQLITTRNKEISFAELKKAISSGNGLELIRPGDKFAIELKNGERVNAVCGGYVNEKRARFVLEDCLAEKWRMNDTPTNKGGYLKSEGRRHVLEDILPLFPDELAEAFEPRFMSEEIDGERHEYADTLWIPSATDVFGAGDWWNEEPDSFGSDRTLYLDGEISDETWFGDEVTPKLFRDELHAGDGNITLWINSPGGDVFAAAQIYNMLMDYPHDVTVKIDALAASAASVIAMAGTKVCMSPVAMMMVHNPATIAIGDTEEMQKAIDMLNEVKESIMNAYEIKSGLSRHKISQLMDAETWMNAKEAVKLGFADEILFRDGEKSVPEDTADTEMLFSRKAVTDSLLSRLIPKKKPEANKHMVPVTDLEKRLSLLAH